MSTSEPRTNGHHQARKDLFCAPIAPFNPTIRRSNTVARNIILVHHLRKKKILEGNKIDIDRVRGSSAIVQVARVVWGVDTPDPQDEGRARMYMVKNNLSPSVDEIGFTIGSHGVTFRDAPIVKKSEGAGQQAADFLIKSLATGPKPSAVVLEEAEQLGISDSTLKRARKRLNIKARRDDGAWQMALPGTEEGQDV